MTRNSPETRRNHSDSYLGPLAYDDRDFRWAALTSLVARTYRKCVTEVNPFAFLMRMLEDGAVRGGHDDVSSPGVLERRCTSAMSSGHVWNLMDSIGRLRTCTSCSFDGGPVSRLRILSASERVRPGACRQRCTGAHPIGKRCTAYYRWVTSMQGKQILVTLKVDLRGRLECGDHRKITMPYRSDHAWAIIPGLRLRRHPASAPNNAPYRTIFATAHVPS
jgi:hypothetical protein